MGTRKQNRSKGGGAAPGAGEKVNYRYDLAKGVAKTLPRDRGNGDELTGYGTGSSWGGPASVGVVESNDLADIDTAVSDPVKAGLVKGDKANIGAQQRTLKPGNVATAHGHRNPNANPTKIPSKMG